LELDGYRENRKRLEKILAYREMQTRYVSTVLRGIFERIVVGIKWTPPNSPLTKRKSNYQSKKKINPRLLCLRTLQAYHDKWVPNYKREYDISPLTSPLLSN
jgi:hypothetical protein